MGFQLFYQPARLTETGDAEALHFFFFYKFRDYIVNDDC